MSTQLEDRERSDARGMDPTAPPRRRSHVVRRLYDWVLGWAETRWALPALFVLAFVESSVFPIPPDLLLIALGIGAPKRVFRVAAWCTLGSVLGGVAGYAIGWGVWSLVETWAYTWLFSPEKFEQVLALYREWGAVFVFAAAFTPIPYKVFTIAAGVAKINLAVFVVASVLGRGGRFFAVAAVIRLMGPAAKQFIDRWFDVLTLAAIALLALGLLLMRWS